MAEGPVERPKKARAKAKITSNDFKWGKEVMAKKFTVIPNLLLDNLQALKIRSAQLVVLIALIEKWWEKENLPYPSMSKLAEQIGIKKAAVQRSINQLAENKIIIVNRRRTKKNGNTSSEYSFEPLVKRLKEFAEKQTATENRHKREKKNYLKKSEGESDDE